MRDQEKNFKALITVSFVLKFIDVLNTIFVQTSYEMFFIDWERPKNIKPQEQPNPKLKLLTDIQIEAKKQSNVITSVESYFYLLFINFVITILQGLMLEKIICCQ